MPRKKIVYGGLPTMLRKESLVPQKWMTPKEKKELPNIKAIDYLKKFFGARVSSSKKTHSDNIPKSMGDKVILLKSGTGSGKSTTFVAEIWLHLFEDNPQGLAITEPRRLTCQSIPYDILNYYPYEMGVNIGFQTGPLSFKPEKKGITFMTYGVLNQQLLAMKPEYFMRKYQLIIIDEVHERTLNIDNILYQLKKMLQEHWDKPECPTIVLMSATFDPKPYQTYFEVPDKNFVEITGLSHPIARVFPKQDVDNIFDYIINTVKKIHIEEEDDFNHKVKDIMIFVDGTGQAKSIMDALHLMNKQLFDRPWAEVKKIYNKEKNKPQSTKKRKGGSDIKHYIAPILTNSDTFGERGVEYQRMFSNIDDITQELFELKTSKNGTQVLNPESFVMVKPSRKVYVATNVAETGLTIDTLKYCLDTGYRITPQFNPNLGCGMLLKTNVSQANALQRKGRVGRGAPGTWFPLYTEKTFNYMSKENQPEVLKTDITMNLLSIIIRETGTQLEEAGPEDKTEENIATGQVFRQFWFDDKMYYKLTYEQDFDCSKVDLFEFPPASSLTFCLEKLYILGFIDFEYKPTIYGVLALKFRQMSEENIRMILSAYRHGCDMMTIATIAAGISTGWKKIGAKKGYQRRNVFNSDYSEFLSTILIGGDFIEYALIWEEYMETVKTLTKSKQNIFQGIKDWCKASKLSYNGLISFSETRDTIIEGIINAGLNPHYNSIGLPNNEYNLTKIIKSNTVEGLNEIKKIKQAILDGYRMNLCIWDKKTFKYLSVYKNLPIQFDSTLTKALPKLKEIKQKAPNFIVTDEIMLIRGFSGKYELTGGLVSIMDGFTQVDRGLIHAL